MLFLSCLSVLMLFATFFLWSSRHEPPVAGNALEIIDLTDELIVVNKPSSIPVRYDMIWLKIKSSFVLKSQSLMWSTANWRSLTIWFDMTWHDRKDRSIGNLCSEIHHCPLSSPVFVVSLFLVHYPFLFKSGIFQPWK